MPAPGKIKVFRILCGSHTIIIRTFSQENYQKHFCCNIFEGFFYPILDMEALHGGTPYMLIGFFNCSGKFCMSCLKWGIGMMLRRCLWKINYLLCLPFTSIIHFLSISAKTLALIQLTVKSITTTPGKVLSHKHNI